MRKRFPSLARLINDATANSKTIGTKPFVRPRKCKMSEYPSWKKKKKKKKRARDFLVAHIQIAALVLTGSPMPADPFAVLHRGGINLLTASRLAFHFFPPEYTCAKSTIKSRLRQVTSSAKIPSNGRLSSRDKIAFTGNPAKNIARLITVHCKLTRRAEGN